MLHSDKCYIKIIHNVEQSHGVNVHVIYKSNDALCAEVHVDKRNFIPKLLQYLQYLHRYILKDILIVFKILLVEHKLCSN